MTKITIEREVVEQILGALPDTIRFFEEYEQQHKGPFVSQAQRAAYIAARTWPGLEMALRAAISAAAEPVKTMPVAKFVCNESNGWKDDVEFLVHQGRAMQDGDLLYQAASPSPAPAVPDAHERELLQLIDERDRREEVINKLCDAVLGIDRQEWSSVYGFEDAVAEVEERMAVPDAAKPETQGEREELIREFESSVSQVARLHNHYIGKAMPDEVYESFAKTRDETIPTLRSALLAAGPAPAVPDAAKPEPSSADLETIIDNYLEGYELRDDPACHTPSDFERLLIKDAVMGLLADKDWDDAWGFHIAAIAVERAAPGAVLEGWQLVPVEPTHEMIYMMTRATANYAERVDSYRAMLSAAPKPQGE